MNKTVEVKTSAKIHSSIGAFLSNMFDFYDLMVLSMALAFIIKEFNLSLGQAGMLGTATLIGCGISVFTTGWISENKGRKTAIIISVVSFSILTMFIGFATSYVQILIIRFLAGIALGGIYTLVGTLLNEVWPPHQRARATTVVMTSSAFGVISVSFLMSVLVPRYGWRSLFVVAISGLLVALYVAVFVPESEVWKRMKEEKKSKTVTPLGEGLKEIFSAKLAKNTILGTLAAFFAQLAFWGFMFWLPMFLIQERHLAPVAVGGYIAFQSIGQIIGVPLSGFIADKIGRKKTLILYFVLGCILIPVFASQQNLQVLFWMLPFMAAIFAYPGLMATYFPELYPTHVRSLGVGFMFNIGRALSAIGPFTLGLLGTMANLQTSISICGFIYVCAGIMVFFMPETLRKKEELDAIKG